MINLKNALVLAGTKLKTRKIRLAVTIIISSLMFGVLTVGVITFAGFTNSVERFSEEGLNNRFFAQLSTYAVGNINGMPIQEYYSYFEKPEAMERARQIANDMVEARAKRAKELGLDFDKKLALKELLPEANVGTGEAKYNGVSPDGLVGQQLGRELLANYSANPLTELNQANVERITQGYDVVRKYQPLNYGVGAASLEWPNETGGYPIESPGKNRFESQPQREAYTGLGAVPNSIVEPFRLARANWSVESGAVPIYISPKDAEKFLELKELPAGASSEELIKRQAEIQDKIANFTFKHCYRNSLAIEQLQQARQHADNKGTKDYVAPDLVYGLPEGDACAVALVISDKRSSVQKKHDAAQHQFDVEFNQQDAEPVAQEITFQVVGLIPFVTQQWGGGGLANQLITLAVGAPNLGNTVAAEDFSLLLEKSDLGKIWRVTGSDSVLEQAFSDNGWIVEFATLAETQKFIKERDCMSVIWQQMENLEDGAGSDGLTCPVDKPFAAYPALNNRVHLEDIIQYLFKAALIILAVVVVIATIIMTATIGRMIADSRRETAVFRAIGFKRFDISRVYGLYAFSVCLLVVVVSLAIGYAGARTIAHFLDHELTNQAILATGTTDHNLKMTMLGFSSQYLGVLVGAILLVGLLAIIFPLIRNLRRNPIKDMRDE